jgi:polyisoprenoid-binding protein YceI
MKGRSRRLGFAIAAVAMTIAATAHAESPEKHKIGVFELDPTRTSISFTLPATLHTVHGSFRLVRGTIKGDWDNGRAEGAIVIDASSGDSGSESRDKKMREDVLEAGKFAEITFSPRLIVAQARSKDDFSAKLDGSLILHGSMRRIAIEVVGRLDGDNLTARGHFTIPYVEWGMKDPSFLFFKVANQVDIDVSTEGRVTWVATEIKHR